MRELWHDFEWRAINHVKNEYHITDDEESYRFAHMNLLHNVVQCTFIDTQSEDANKQESKETTRDTDIKKKRKSISHNIRYIIVEACRIINFVDNLIILAANPKKHVQQYSHIPYRILHKTQFHRCVVFTEKKRIRISILFFIRFV